MELRHLYDSDDRYVGDPVFFNPYGEVEGTGFGMGEGTVTGDRITGTVQWTNHPRLREDDVWCPNLVGRISTADDADVILTLAGYSNPRADRAGRDIVASCRFTSGDRSYTWLNTVLGIAEGRIDAEGRRVTWRVYECVHGSDRGGEPAGST